jgi:hypothetical protein
LKLFGSARSFFTIGTPFTLNLPGSSRRFLHAYRVAVTRSFSSMRAEIGERGFRHLRHDIAAPTLKRHHADTEHCDRRLV